MGGRERDQPQRQESTQLSVVTTQVLKMMDQTTPTTLSPSAIKSVCSYELLLMGSKAQIHHCYNLDPPGPQEQ